MKEFIKSIINYLRYNFPEKHKDNKKYNLNKFQIYPKGINYNKTMTDYCIALLNKINFNINEASCVGTCFAEEFAKLLSKKSKNYNILEQNVFSFQANWGRIYTVKNLKQLIDYTFDKGYPIFSYKVSDGYMDPLRDYTCGSFLDEAKLKKSVINHRISSEMILKNKEFLFITLGQTEAWFDVEKKFFWGAAPVKSDKFYRDRNKYKYINFTVQDIIEDLIYVVNKLKKFNKKVKIVFTLSPVPAFATFLKKNVILSSSEGKAKLRIALEKITDEFDYCFYFPSFECVILDNNNFNSDNRHVKTSKIKQIFKVF